MKIDLRSDTVTQPTAAMRAFMLKAPVGDDVFGEDPSILELEQKICSLFGTDAAMFTPTATMSNQIAIKLLTQPLDEVICDRTSHIYSYEVGGFAFHSGCSVRYLFGERGVFTAADVAANINPDDVHKPITRMVNIENTVNRGGGKIFPLTEITSIHAVCKAQGLKMHLDGSRLFNAMVAAGTNAKDYGKLFDTITLCFSKGLGAPVGSVLTGKKEHLDKARRIRKVFGGGMRQAGIMAAGCIYALNHHIDRLAEDHLMARRIEQKVVSLAYVETILPVETNIIIFRLKQGINDTHFIDHLAQHDIHAFAIGDNWVRFVTHLDIHPEMESAIYSALENFG